jgi:hypothetical protein
LLYLPLENGFKLMWETWAMALYEIRTLKTQRRTSLIAFGDFKNDLAAILAARGFLRRRETVEVWRGDALIFRTGPDNHTGRMQLGK